MNSLINYLDKYHTQLTVLLLGLSLIVFAVFLWVWFYNRRKYNHLKHQIPASVVKNYLDSIIQNSTALKSSLFRGGGLDVDANGVPSVMPLSDLPSGASVNLAGAQDDTALKAELAKLQAQLSEKNGTIRDLENKNIEISGENKAKQERIEELERLLAQASSEGGNDPAAQETILKLTEERDRLAEDLMQYEVISDDLADLKRLKQENAQLKRALEAAGGSVSDTAPEALDEDAAPAEEFPEYDAASEAEEAEEMDEDEAMMAAAMNEPSSDEAADEPQAETDFADEFQTAASEDESNEREESKSPEDLLSEFEKMLG